MVSGHYMNTPVSKLTNRKLPGRSLLRMWKYHEQDLGSWDLEIGVAIHRNKNSEIRTEKDFYC